MLDLVLAAAAPTNPADYILHHVADSHRWELPVGRLANEIDLHSVFGTWMLGGVDVTPTKLTCMMWLSALLLVVGLLFSMRRRGPLPAGRLQNVIEMLFLFVRDEIAAKTIEHDHKRYTPFLATCFFFILLMNLSGLIPYCADATGNIYVTGVLAIGTFIVTQIAGMRGQGVVGYWAHLVPKGVPFWLYPLMLVLEIVSLFTKPFALTMRLFANMLAGHIVIFFLLGLVFFLAGPHGEHAGAGFVGIGTVPLALGIYLLEIFIAFLQAYIFTILSSLFIGMAAHAH